jgi:hypothetical protein
MLAATTPLHVVSKLLGHSSATFTASVYQHVDEEQGRPRRSGSEAGVWLVTKSRGQKSRLLYRGGAMSSTPPASDWQIIASPFGSRPRPGEIS